MNNFKRIFSFIIPYKKYAYLNIFFNVLYALFSTLSFMSLIPMMQVLFDQTKRNTVEPIYTGIWEFKTICRGLFKLLHHNDNRHLWRRTHFIHHGCCNYFNIFTKKPKRLFSHCFSSLF